MDVRAFVAPKRLRPRRRVKPAHNSSAVWIAPSMKIPRWRKNAHVARMTMFLRRNIRLRVAIIVERLDQHSARE
jgi:hypothetical protein